LQLSDLLKWNQERTTREGGGGRILTEIQKGIREIYTVWRTIHSAGGYV
jgi:hypothetical protein